MRPMSRMGLRNLSIFYSKLPSAGYNHPHAKKESLMHDSKAEMANDMGVRRFGAVNWLGTWTLARREVLRFMNVWSQTIMGPLVNAGLFLLILRSPSARSAVT